MALYWEKAGREVEVQAEDFREGLSATLAHLGNHKKFSRFLLIIRAWTAVRAR